MALHYETISRFVRDHGRVCIVDTKGKSWVLTSGDPDVWDLCEKADRFFYDGKWYSRAEFEKIVEGSE